MEWRDLEHQQPRLAARARELLVDPGVLLVGTTRTDGTARISAVEPFLLDGGLWLSMMWGSRKAADLLRDPRILLHSIVTRPDQGGEVMLRGRAVDERDQRRQQRYADAVGSALDWTPTVGDFHLFRVDIAAAAYVSHNERGDQHVALWPEGREFVRPIVSATKVGEPEPVEEVLV